MNFEKQIAQRRSQHHRLLAKVCADMFHSNVLRN